MVIQFYKKDNYYLFNKGKPFGNPLQINNIINKSIDTIQLAITLNGEIEELLLLLKLQFKIDKYEKELYEVVNYEYKGEHKYIIIGKLNIVNYLFNNYNVDGIFTKKAYYLNNIYLDKNYLRYTELELLNNTVDIKYYNLNNVFTFEDKIATPEFLAFHVDKENSQTIKIEKTNILTSDWLDAQYKKQTFITFSYNPLGIPEKNYNKTTRYKINFNLQKLYENDNNYLYKYLNTNIFKIFLHISNNKIDFTQIKELYIIIDILPKLEVIDNLGNSHIYTIGQSLYYNVTKESEILKNNPLYFQQQQINRQIEYNNFKMSQINSYINMASNLTNITNNPLNVLTNTTTNLLNISNNSTNYNLLKNLRDKQIEQLDELHVNVSQGSFIDFKIDNNNIIFSVEKKTPVLIDNKYILNCYKPVYNMNVNDFTEMYYYGGYLLNTVNVPKSLINQANSLLKG